jgi:hypothetical protein
MDANGVGARHGRRCCGHRRQASGDGKR